MRPSSLPVSEADAECRPSRVLRRRRIRRFERYQTAFQRRQHILELGEFLGKMYPRSRPKIAHPVYEIGALPTVERGTGTLTSDPVIAPTDSAVM